MSSALLDKWIHDVSPDDRTSDVAARTLRRRLAAVQHYLPLAAEKCNEDMEYVHERRVVTRRATVALSLYADMLPRRRTARMEKRLKQIPRGNGDRRGCDVRAHRRGASPRIAADTTAPLATSLLVEAIRSQSMA